MRHVLIGVLITVAALSGRTEARVFRSISELATASRDDYAHSRRFELTAQVISKRGSIVTLHDGVAGNTFRNLQYHPQPFEVGDIIKTRGGLESGRGSWLFLNLRVVTVVGHRPLPPVRKLSGSEINDAAFQHQRVQMQGVLTSIVPDDTDPRFTWLTFNTPSGPFATVASTNEWAREALSRQIDSEMEVSGIVTPFEGWRKELGQFITTESSADLRVIRPAPADPFAAPEFNQSPAQHRRRATGSVIAVGNDRFYMRTSEHPLIQVIPDESESLPGTGDYVEAVGFIRKSPFNPILSDALIRPASPPPAVTGAAKILINPQPFEGQSPGRAQTTLNGRIIQATGNIERMNHEPNSGFILEVDGTDFVVETKALKVAELQLAPQCKVTVTGLCLLRFAAPYSQSEFPHFDHFVLIPRAAGEITVIDTPSWWTPFRLFLVLIGMSPVLVGILIWNHALRVRSEQRARELTRERLERTKTEVKIEERTRLAVELHDSISQMLTGVALQLDSAVRAEKEGKIPSRNFLESAKQMLGSCRKELQDCLWDLRSRTFAEHDLTEAVNRTLAPHIGKVRLEVRFNVPRQDLSESTTHTVLSIVRELCVNAIRHGRAQHLQVAGEAHDNSISFSVRDNGCGFVPEEANGPDSGHFGLSGIRERLNAYNGTLTIESAPGQGCRATVKMYLDKANQV